MGAAALTRTAEMVSKMTAPLTAADKEYVVQFAYHTADGELTNKLIDELLYPDANKAAIYQKYETMVDFRPDLIRAIEDLLVSLEMYRVREKMTLKALTEILSAYGLELTEEEIGKLSPETLRKEEKEQLRLEAFIKKEAR